MNKFKGKYRIPSNRKPNWDYSEDAFYFLTINTQNRECNLGEIVPTNIGASQMILSDFGKIVESEWYKSFEIRDELILDVFVIMPNHIHAIVEIKNNSFQSKNHIEHDNGDYNITGVETHGRASLHIIPDLPIVPDLSIVPNSPIVSDLSVESNISVKSNLSMNSELLSIKRNPPKRLPKSISSFMAGFKSAVNSKIDDYIDIHNLQIPKYNRNNHFFQPNYHDHIIRNNTEYTNISNYIMNNPSKWNIDKFNTKKG